MKKKAASAGSELARQKWAKKTAAERKAHGRMMAEARWSKDKAEDVDLEERRGACGKAQRVAPAERFDTVAEMEREGSSPSRAYASRRPGRRSSKSTTKRRTR